MHEVEFGMVGVEVGCEVEVGVGEVEVCAIDVGEVGVGVEVGEVEVDKVGVEVEVGDGKFVRVMMVRLSFVR